MRSQTQSGEFQVANDTVRTEQVAPSTEELQRLVSEGMVDQALAEALWRRGDKEARMFAIKLAEANRCSRYRLDSWLASASDTSEVEAVARIAALTPNAYETALHWIHSDAERSSLAGWSLVAELVAAGKLDTERAAALLECVDEELDHHTTTSSEAVLKARGALESGFPEIAGTG